MNRLGKIGQQLAVAAAAAIISIGAIASAVAPGATGMAGAVIHG